MSQKHILCILRRKVLNSCLCSFFVVSCTLLGQWPFCCLFCAVAGFVTPDGGGEDVFIHRSALKDGVVLSPGQKVSYEGQWDPNKKKYKAAHVSHTTSQTSAEVAAPQSSTKPATYHIAASFNDWQIAAQPMTQSGGEVRQRIAGYVPSLARVVKVTRLTCAVAEPFVAV